MFLSTSLVYENGAYPAASPRKRGIRRAARLLKWQYLGLCLLVLLTIILHAVTIMEPAEPAFDEQHYVKDARSIIAERHSDRTEHPPLGKLFVVAGILIFGDNPLGWRFFSVFCGALCVIFFYLICRKLGLPEKATFLAGLIFSLENLTFVQASVAMLDVYSLVFMLGAFLLYLKGRYPLTGIVIALSTLAKLNGALALPVIGLHWLFSGRPKTLLFLLGLMLAPMGFVALMPVFDYAVTGELLSPAARIMTMMERSSSLTFETVSHGSASQPWIWIIRPIVMYYWYTPRYTGAISFTVWGLIVPAVVYMAVRAVKKSGAAIFGIAWFIGTYLIWIPVVLITNRVTYPYYFYPAVGSICLGIGMALSQLIDFWKNRRTGKLRWVAIGFVVLFLVLHVGVFVILSPVSYPWVRVIESLSPQK